MPSFARGVAPRGLTSGGVMLADTTWAALQDGDGNWLFPAYAILSDSTVQELPGPGTRQTEVYGINDCGQIIGGYQVPDPDDPDSVMYFNGIWQLNADGTISGPTELMGDFRPSDINNLGVMAGTYMGYPAIAWFEGATLEVIQLPPSPMFLGADVNALNDCPIDDPGLTVVGPYYRDEDGNGLGRSRGYAWRPLDSASSPTLLGTLGGRGTWPFGVNSQGEIVGMSDTTSDGQQAFIFKNGKMSNLNSMADVGRKRKLVCANAINDDGDIVGYMGIALPVGEQRGFCFGRFGSRLSYRIAWDRLLGCRRACHFC